MMKNNFNYKLLIIIYSSIKRRKFHSCGSNLRLHFPANINNPNKIKIGSNVSIAEYCWLNCIEESKNEISLKIGNNCSIGRFAHINAYEKVILEDFVLISDRVHISDVSHIYRDENIPIMSQGAEFKGPVVIKNGAWIGIGAVVLPGVTIGRNSIVGANAVLTKDVPDFHVAKGVPAQVDRIKFKDLTYHNH
jgi:acetyltransferase-like isoleucine patch superfamily enzyme